jgi:hypothetical protein
VDTTLLPLVTGAGVAGVFCILFILGYIFPRAVVEDLKKEKAELQDALDAERASSKAAIAAAQTTRDIIAAFHAGQDQGSHK